MMFWNEKIETMPVEEYRKVQLDKLQKLVAMLYEKNEYYRDKMVAKGVKPEDIKTLEDIRKLPFMYKQDLRDWYPTKMFNVPNKDVVRYHVSSGTSGKPTLVGYTQGDLDYWTEALARALTSAGLNSDDTLQVSYGYGLFTGGLGLHYGGEKIGATVLPASTGNTERQIELMQDLGVTAIACTPSYMNKIIDTAKSMGVDIKRDTKLRLGFFGAEPWTEAMRHKIEEDTGIQAHDIYGTSEMAGPMYTDCSEKNGIHIPPDIMLVEIIDPETEEPVADGQRGEIVITMLCKEAMPMIRYRIKDITSITHEKCRCGRTAPRIARISGRADDMLIIRGINVFPSQIEYALLRIPQLSSNYMIHVTSDGILDQMTVQAEIKSEAFTDDLNAMNELRAKCESELKKYLNIAVKVELKMPGELPRFEGKAKRVIDKRPKE